MKTLSHFIVMLLSISLCMPTTQAQPAPDTRQEAQTTNKIAQDVLIIIQQEQVRFTAQKTVEEMQLQIFDQTGSLVYDSGAVTGGELTWVLRQAGGEAVKSGLYAYTLSVKEAGASEARLRRGHFIVDRAKERDGETDRLWITSQNESGVGTELTVARNEGVTVAGTSASTDQKSARAAETVTGGKESELTAAAAATAGTTGRIAKFVSATDLGDSAITESSGNIGIGVTNPGTKLAVATPTSSYGISHTDGVATLSTFVGAGSSGVTNGGWIGTVSNHDLRFFTANGPPRMTITPSGNIGIGTINPGTTKLAVFTPTNSYGIAHFDGDATLATFVGAGTSEVTNGGWIGTLSNHPLRFFAGNHPATMTISASGNVGIGTGDPQEKLHVVGKTVTSVLQITGGADFAENFDINETTSSEAMAAKVEAGMVVSLDPASPGKLTLSARGYDRRVAGVVSGAGGVKPGMVMSQEGTLAEGKYPVALSGRVYCWVDASQGAIEVGDLLTTSSTPGHAMKAMDTAKAQGAIIGKAMTSLKSGKGLILVLVSLQ